MQYTLLTVILIEDDDVDIESFSRILKGLEIPHHLVVCHEGQGALSLLRKKEEHWGQTYPCLVFIDLCLPGMNGFEFLDELRKDPALRTVIAFVLSDAIDDVNLAAAYDRAIAGYIPKSRLRETGSCLAELLTAYWQMVEFPAHQPNHTQVPLSPCGRSGMPT